MKRLTLVALLVCLLAAPGIAGDMEAPPVPEPTPAAAPQGPVASSAAETPDPVEAALVESAVSLIRTVLSLL